MLDSTKIDIFSTIVFLIILFGTTSPAPVRANGAVNNTNIAYHFLGNTAPVGFHDDWKVLEVTPGVIWKSKNFSSLFGAPQVVNVVAIDLGNPKLHLEVIQADGCETVSQMARNSGAVVGINGGFFCLGADDICGDGTQPCPSGCPGRSLLIDDGTLESTNCLVPSRTSRTTFGRTEEGWAMAGIGPGLGWPKVSEAIGAGPNLVSPSPNGPVIRITDEGFPWMDAVAPRTAVGLTEDRLTVLFVTFDGRNADAKGVTIAELASFMHTLGATWAMNFDGGGSTTLYIHGKGTNGVVNKPSDGKERAVFDGLFLLVESEGNRQPNTPD